MAIIKGTYYYKGNRPYKYEVKVHDVADGFKTFDFSVHVINPEGKTAIVSWHFKHYGIEESIRQHIEMLIERKRQLSSH
jgi:hypothetical protein